MAALTYQMVTRGFTKVSLPASSDEDEPDA